MTQGLVSKGDRPLCFGATLCTIALVRIDIQGRRWFQKTYGNTYFSSQAIVDGEPVGGIDFQYGYGDHYLYETLKALAERGIVPPLRRHANGATEALREWAERNRIVLSHDALDVKRKKDL